MNEINDEIRQTINLMQTVNDECVYSAMQGHLKGLLEIKRNELQQRLTRGSWVEPDLEELAKPLTTEDLMDGGWWCADTSEDALKAFILYGFETEDGIPWEGFYYGCFLYENGRNLLDRGFKKHTDGLKEIHRVGNEFYWGEK